MASFIKRTRLFPAYSNVHADLLIEEVTLASMSYTHTASVDTTPVYPPALHHDIPNPGFPTGPNTIRHGAIGAGGQGRIGWL